jgi:mannosyltransferase/alpha 1,2-mannosyltransferase
VLGCPAESSSDNTWLTLHKRRESAAILLLARDGDLEALLPTLANFESKFNARFRYPYIFLNEDSLSQKFQQGIRDALPKGAVVEFGTIPKEHWSIPDWLDKEKVREGFQRMKEENIQYADRESYHHMCRYYSGLFALHPLMLKYNYYWRLEPGGTMRISDTLIQS